MPEIPEMETYKNLLERSVLVKQIKKAEVNRPKTLNLPADEFISKVEGQFIKSVGRRAKFIIFELTDGNFLLAHMMLGGRMTLTPADEEVKAQVVLILNDSNKLNFSDMRLGYLHYHTPFELEEELRDLGVEPLSAEFTWQRFGQLLSGRRGTIKPFLMEQKYIAGIGNAYSNEILFLSRIMPDRKISGLKDEEKQVLFEKIPHELRKAVEQGGYIETPFAVWDDKSGGMLDKFKVYDREGEACLVCGNTIKRTEIGGRNAFYCDVCQK